MRPSSKEQGAKESPRSAQSRERLQRAQELIAEQLRSGEWVSSNEIHRNLKSELGGTLSEGMFGRAKKALGVEHRRTRSEGRTRYEWRLAKPTRAKGK